MKDIIYSAIGGLVFALIIHGLVSLEVAYMFRNW